jgi:multidrug efflux system membrane fusion protein
MSVAEVNCMKYQELILASLVGILLAGCEQPEIEVAEIVRPVRYVKVVPIGAAETRIFSGVTKAALETDLSFKVGGLVTELNAAVGDVLKSGQVVAALEPTDFEVRVREAEAGLERARAEQRSAQAGFERTRELYENRNASRSDLDTGRAMAESAAALVRAANQQMQGARLQLSYTRLSSPLACSVARRHVELNQNVAAGQPVVRVNCGDCPEIRLDVPGLYIGRVSSGAAVEVTIAALPGRQFNGTVTEVGIGTDQNRSIYPVIVQLSDGCDAARSGMAADVKLQLSGESAGANQMVVPMVAVGEDRSGNFVFVLEPAEAVESNSAQQYFVAYRRGVTLGPVNAQGIEIVAGISEGDLVATAGVRRLVDRQVVMLLEGNGR